MRIFIILFLCIPVAGLSQNRMHLTLFGGFSNYQGDLQEKRFTTDQSNAAIGVGVSYNLTPHFSVRSGIMYGSLEANDKKNSSPFLKARNLNFQTRLFEFNALAQYTLFDLQDKKISPYVFAGVALFRFNPYAFDSLGNKVFLKPLSTEGQGLSQYPAKKKYKLTQFSIPLGGGVKFRITDNAVLGFEVGLRKLFTDYIDDISGTYADPAILAMERGQKAVELSYRGGELKDGNQQYPAEGTIRGSAKFKDWYYFSGLTLSVGINTGKRVFGRAKKASTGCPDVVL